MHPAVMACGMTGYMAFTLPINDTQLVVTTILAGILAGISVLIAIFGE